MDYINEKVAYIKGLCDGLGINESTNEGKVLTKIVDVLDDITDALEGIGSAYDDLEDYVELIDEDLMEVEDEVYGLDLYDDEEYELECPNCNEEFLVDEEDLESEGFIIECPNCGYEIDLSTYGHDCECGDDCHCHDE